MKVSAPPRPRPRRAQCTAGPGVSAAVIAGAVLHVAAGIVPRAARAQPSSASPPRPAATNAPADPIVWGPAERLVTLGSTAEERARLGQLLGRDSTAGFLLRSASTRTPVPPAPSGRVAAALVRPELLVVRNSAIPMTDNDGALWAGRGTSVIVRGGIAVRVGRVSAALVPEMAYARNLGFQSQPAFLGGQRPPTGSFAAQWFTGAYAADLPVRFGDQSYTVYGFGQSHLTVTAGRVAVGASTENQWWGPGVRNALLVSNAAEGMPHAFLRTARPLRTRLGDVEARWFLGAPTRSLYFVAGDSGVTTGRVLNGAAVTLRVAAEPGLTVGLARLVLTPSRGNVVGHAFDVLVRNDNLGTGDTLRTRLGSDQLASVFARWVFPGARAEAYGEFARLELPRSLRDFALAPLNTGAYTLGVAHAFPGPRAGTFRGQLEVTSLEQTRAFTGRPPPPDYYTGRAAPAGFTSRGQPVGAAVGPGSSSQWLALDYYRPRWQLGGFAQRTRNQNDAMYRVFLPNAFRHDVTLAGGVRGGVRRGGVDALATLTAAKRLNYLFQSGSFNILRQGSVDVSNVTLGLSLSPAPPVPRGGR